MSRTPWIPVLALAAGVATAQCAPVWGPVLGLPGTSGSVRAMATWDPDGAGSAAPLLVVGGTMDVAGPHTVTYVATYDRASRTWAPLGNPGYLVDALAVLPTGELVAAGLFANVVRWTGAAWVPLGGPHDGVVRALAVLPSGELVAAGEFTAIGGVAAASIARWDGASWSPLGAGIGGGAAPERGVYTLAVAATGELFAGGNFTLAGGVAAGGIASWNGTAWSSLGTGVAGGTPSNVRALLPLPGGGVLAAGSFASAGAVAAANVALWTGSAWAPLGTLGAHPYALHRLQNGVVVAVGTWAGGVAAWNGTAWQVVPMVPGNAGALAVLPLPTGELALGLSQSPPFHGVALWNGSALEQPTPGIAAGPQGGSGIATAASLRDGSVLVGGSFGSIAGVAASTVARWDGTTWHGLGSGTDREVSCAVELPGGDVVVGGLFNTAGGVAANNVARWNGSSWSPLGAGTDQTVHALAVLPGGDVVAGGDFTQAGGVVAQRIARWNGSVWSPLGAGTNGTVFALAVLPGGDLVAGGRFGVAGGVAATGIARWDGAAWSSIGTFTGIPSPFPPLPSTPPYVTCLLTLRGGDLLAAGGFTAAAGVATQNLARWNGAAWSDFSGGVATGVRALLELPDGDVLAAGAAPMGVLRRDGAGWTAVAPASNRTGTCLALRGPGEVVLGGTLPSGPGTGFVTMLAATCPAAAIPAGAGCIGSAGALALAATALPWVGGRFAARSTGVPANAVVVVASGFAAAAIPLVQLLPDALPGCDLLVAPDVLELATPVAGAATSGITIPDVPALVGVVVHHQHVVVELGATVPIAAVTSTNALVLTVGVL